MHKQSMQSLRMAFAQFWATQPTTDVNGELGFAAFGQDVLEAIYKATTLQLSLLPQVAIPRAESAGDTARTLVTSSQTTVPYMISCLAVLKPHQSVLHQSSTGTYSFQYSRQEVVNWPKQRFLLNFNFSKCWQYLAQYHVLKVSS